MRARFALLLALLLIVPSVQALAPVAWAQDEADTGTEGSGGSSEGEDGASDPEAETGAEGGAVEEEEGPPWTYQMARITLVLLLLLFLAMGLLYWRLLASRQRAGA